MAEATQESELQLMAHSIPKKVAVSSFLGNFIEWFDFATYTYFAVYIGEVFFPSTQVNPTLMAFAVFAIAFIFRPLGGSFWGGLGDRRGRKFSLSMSIFLVSGASFCIGLVPSYAAIGMAAPILLLILRATQAFSVAGEYSGAAVYLSEFAPVGHRGRFCALVPASTATGLLGGSTAALLIKAFMDADMIMAIGWRIPFLLALPLGFIAWYIRVHLDDSETYAEAVRENKITKGTTKKVFSKYGKRLLSSIAATMVNSVGFYLVLTYCPTYLQSYTTMDPAVAQACTDIALLVYIFIVFFAGKLSDKFGRKEMLLAACVAFIVLSIPAYLLLGTASLPLVIIAQLILCIMLSLNDGNIACYQAEMFPTEVRYTGAALGSNIAYVIFGGTASMVATALIDATGNTLSPAFYMMGIAVVAGIILIFTGKDYNNIPLDEIE